MSTSHRSVLAVLIALPVAVVLLTGCDIKFTGQELQLRPNEDGSLDVLLVYRGVSAAKDDEETVSKVLPIAREFLEGRRRFAFPLWPGEVDLDDPKVYQGLDEEVVALLQGIALVEHGVFLDAEGRLSAYQRIRLPDLACAIRCLNRSISEDILAQSERGNLKPDKDFDERTCELWLERARSGDPWLLHQDGLFVFDLPMTRATTDRLQRKLLDEVARAGGREGWLAGLLSHLRHLEILDESVVLAFGAPGTGVFDVVFDDPEAEYGRGLLDALAQEGIHPDPRITLDEVRGMLRW